mmetsp:Transcript_9851/g.31962  ORF Transcript_9851/g.31962 Transcript_9851/m.31962 type:complete len:224 (-) Transcript_9851:738-1409(-)
MARASFSPRGHRGRRSTCASSPSTAAGGGSDSPSANRSTPVHATITPLSVQSPGGGQTSARPCVCATASSRALTTLLQATPPATTRERMAGSSSNAHPTAREVLSSRCFTATVWKPAAMSLCACSSSPSSARGATSPATSSTSPSSLSMHMRVAVLSPAYEKSHVLFLSCRMGTENRNRLSSPSRAAASSAGPPPRDRSSPNRRAVLSYASPTASSIVVPRRV